MDGASIFYVSTINEASEILEFTTEEIAHWRSHWKKGNNNFEKFLSSMDELKFFKNLKFFVCDGNHCLLP
jgi:hypothetical protein